MAKRTDKTAAKVKHLFDQSSSMSRSQWEYVNQKGFDFANDNQLTEQERVALEAQGMPTFTINRILPVVEMLNFYATANNPRWQAIGVEGSDSDVASVFSDISDYIWNKSDGSALYSNTINDSITKSVGYMMVNVDHNSDNGLGDVIITQPEPFDMYVDPKSRDLLYRDAAYILCRKILPRQHLISLYPEYKAKIKSASDSINNDNNYTEKSFGSDQKDFGYKDIGSSESLKSDGEKDDVLSYYELFEKIKVPYVNVFFRIPPSPEQLKAIEQNVNVQMKEMRAEMEVQLMEQQLQMQQAVEAGQMIPERFQLEMTKAQKMMEDQLLSAKNELISQMQAEATVIDNQIISEKEFIALSKNREFAKNVVDSVQFHGTRVQQICVVGDKTLYKKVLPENITEYPIVPFHFKWTGTPYPISAVSPLIGKQRELNKSHQILVHNASLGSSLRWMHEEGSIDTDHWEQYSSSPGALLPIRPGSTPPTPVQPAPLSNAFFTIVQEGKSDMEYLAGIYSSMQGDTGAQHETYRGMLALDEYGTRRIKQWMKHSIEPALKQLGEVIMQYSQSVYTAQKRFRIVQPSAIQEGRDLEINIPIYNDMGEAIGKSMDFASAKFDVRVVAGSTLPVNRWAYLAELKELLQLGVVDDIAVLAETDIKNKGNVAKRKSLYSQLQGQLSSMEEAIKDKEGTIETLERQLVQAGIKMKVNQAEVEINKKKEEVKSKLQDKYLDTEAKQKVLQSHMAASANIQEEKIRMEANNRIKDLQNKDN